MTQRSLSVHSMEAGEEEGMKRKVTHETVFGFLWHVEMETEYWSHSLPHHLGLHRQTIQKVPIQSLRHHFDEARFEGEVASSYSVQMTVEIWPTSRKKRTTKRQQIP